MWLEKAWVRTAPLLFPLGYLYGKLMLLRRRAYRQGLLPAYRPRAFVISVGNLSLGGEGKTPLALWLAEFLKNKGFRVAILTRGYKGKVKGPAVAGRGEGPLLGPEDIGDEAYLLATRSKCPVMVAKDRVQGAFWAIKEFEAQVLILDDGFQHLRLERDLDLVLFSARKDLFSERVFPAGRLREPLEVLNSADAFLITKANEAPRQAKTLARRLKPFGKPCFKIPFQSGKPYPLGVEDSGRKSLSTMSIFAFAGLGDPESFRLAAEKIAPLAGFLALPDHVCYTTEVVARLRQLRLEKGAQAFLTTEKDAVKLGPFVKDLSPCYVLPLKAIPGKDFEEFLLAEIRKSSHL